MNGAALERATLWAIFGDGDAAVDHLLDLPGDPLCEDYGMVARAWAVDRVSPIAVFLILCLFHQRPQVHPARQV